MEISRIAFEQLKNTRDLGQFTTIDGRTICPRRLLRSGNLHNLSLEDRAILQNDYQLKTVIDFRTETERHSEPDTKIGNVIYHWIPILDEATMGITGDGAKEKDGLQQLRAVLMDQQFDAKQYMIHTYRQLILSSYSRNQYRKFFQLLLTAPTDGAILWHCSAGKDRVGIATFLLLCALGVAEEIAAEDYLATNTFYADSLNQMIAQMVEMTGSKDIIPKIDAMFSVSPDYLNAVRQEIQTKFGGLDAFLEHEIGLDMASRTALQDLFLKK
ncbi:MAG: tyrosine-protein phosphatase [Eubacteriales bacterium]|nr:tyrosine-protein phosphatase [Eubacteriales bacterium]